MSQRQDPRLSRARYEELARAGLFHPESRLELIEGGVRAMTPQSSRHAAAVQLTQRALEAAYGRGWSVRVQMPLAVGEESLPEPDIAVVRGEPRDHRDAHPDTAVLVVEIADTSLVHDRERKRDLYARAGIPAYWIVDLLEEGVEVHEQPVHGAYRVVVRRRRGERVGGTIRVEDLLP